MAATLTSALHHVARSYLDQPVTDGTPESVNGEMTFPEMAPEPETRIPEVMALVTVLITVSAVVVFARISARLVFAGGLGKDDFAILFALVLSAGQAACNYIAIQNGFLGRHIWDVIFAGLDLENQTKVGYASQLIYHSALYFTRLSIVLFLARLFPARKVLHWTVGGVTTAVYIAGFFALAFQCKYPQWQFYAENCVNQNALYMSNGSIGVVLDFVLLIIPIVLVVRLNLEKRQKMALIFVFALGAFVCIAGIIRLTTLYKATLDPDISWHAVGTVNWSQAEVNVAIICASLPALKPLFRSFFRDKLETLNSNDSTAKIAIMVVDKEDLLPR